MIKIRLVYKLNENVKFYDHFIGLSIKSKIENFQINRLNLDIHELFINFYGFHIVIIYLGNSL